MRFWACSFDPEGKGLNAEIQRRLGARAARVDPEPRVIIRTV